MKRKNRSPAIAFALNAALMLAGAPSLAHAQERDVIPNDVRVGIVYQPSFRPGIAFPRIEAPEELSEMADSVRRIILRDFDYSDRLEPMGVGEDVRQDGPVNYPLWDELGAVWLMIGVIEGPADSPVLRLSLHDVVFRLLQDVRAFELPPLRHPDVRLAIHQASDLVIEWATGSSGVAATRVAYVAPGPGGSEIFMVDSDGFRPQRLTRDSSIALSPAWSPDGERIAYMSYQDGDPAIYQFDVQRRSTQVMIDLPGMDMTPTFSPDGTRLGLLCLVIISATFGATFSRQLIISLVAGK